jgi:nucleoside-diphosphate-sugar epimerase
MRVLVIGGTGLISRGILKQFAKRNAELTVFNRGKRDVKLPDEVRTIIGDRNDAAALSNAARDGRFDVVIDMVSFNQPQAIAAVDAFAGHCIHFIFCSTVCTYGIASPPGIFVDETLPQNPISGYGRDKVACEKTFLQADHDGKFHVTIVRPSNTYGPGSGMIDNLEGDAIAWDRIEKDLPVLCAGDGLGLWVSTHRDDCGKFFAYAGLNPATYGQAYNTTRPQHMTWREYYRQVGSALGKHPRLLFLPASVITGRDKHRFGLLREITAFHGAYDSSKAVRHVPEFQCEIDLPAGAAETFEDAKRRGAWKSSAGDAVYESLVKTAADLGIEATSA